MADMQTTTYSTRFSAMAKPDVDEKIGLFAPTETPFLASISAKKTTNTNPQWNEDELALPSENANLEGADVESAAYEQPQQYGNWTQIFHKVYKISGTSRVIDQYGKNDELAYARGKATKELARDLEYNFLNNTGSAGSATTARKLKGAFSWVDTDSANYYDFNGTPAATNHITEEILNDIMQSMCEEGVFADTVLAPPAQKRKISSFTFNGRVTVNANQSERKIQEVVNIFETDFGVVAVKPEMFIAPIEHTVAEAKTLYDRMLIYKREIFVRRILRGIKRETLAKTGDNEKEMMVTEQTLQCKSSKGVGVISNLTRAKAVA